MDGVGQIIPKSARVNAILTRATEKVWKLVIFLPAARQAWLTGGRCFHGTTRHATFEKQETYGYFYTTAELLLLPRSNVAPGDGCSQQR